MRFARLLAKRVPVGVLAGSGLRALAQGRHGLLDRREHVAILARAALDEGIPPALAIGETREPRPVRRGDRAGGRGRAPRSPRRAQAYRARPALSRFSWRLPPRFEPVGELDRVRQVDETQGRPMVEAMPHGHPFGREGREGEEGAGLRPVRPVDEQRHRRCHRRIGDERDQGVCIRRPFDEQAIGPERIEGRAQRAGRARPVVADAEDPNLRHRGRGWWDEGSWHARYSWVGCRGGWRAGLSLPPLRGRVALAVSEGRERGAPVSGEVAPSPACSADTLPRRGGRVRTPSRALAGGAVEVLPLRPFLHDGLEIFAPDDGVLHRILDHRATDAGDEVVGREVAVAEMSAPAPARCRRR